VQYLAAGDHFQQISLRTASAAASTSIGSTMGPAAVTAFGTDLGKDYVTTLSRAAPCRWSTISGACRSRACPI
jgi:hypothetical protein